jgi:anti-anti-sigma regulatory factor
MRNTTMIVPVGALTPELTRRIREAATERAQQSEVIISMQSTERCSWSGLCELADFLAATLTPYRIRLTRALPQTRALLHELGLENARFANEPIGPVGRSIVIA